MPASAEPSSLLHRPDIWRGDRVAELGADCVASGYAALDALLPGAGWPCGALSELLLDQPGIGELELLHPALARLSAEGAWLAWVAPALPVYAPALLQWGLSLERLLVLPVKGLDALWCVEQILSSGAFGGVVAWLPEAQPPQMRRLQVAAQGQRPLAFVMRPSACAQQSSPAPLRVALHAGRHARAGLSVHVFKRRGAPVAQSIEIDIPRPVFRIDHGFPALAGAPFSASSARSLSAV
ncbi:translesion DNA synthesis-associated protein ImuA [Uliginosibacterium gangwonense]|uniref:translesion DNA synthesis-associated protein ImuA n=1 Tax=Uliginosibacterium gangwonense TaxID=392736 RepID=UPI00036BAA7C|nr:translesion DNA synthesis-associated protein ImuA [Uliginosibacterium gangwonense]